LIERQRAKAVKRMKLAAKGGKSGAPARRSSTSLEKTLPTRRGSLDAIPSRGALRNPEPWNYGLEEEKHLMRRHEQIRRSSLDGISSAHKVALQLRKKLTAGDKWQKRQSMVSPELPSLSQGGYECEHLTARATSCPPDITSEKGGIKTRNLESRGKGRRELSNNTPLPDIVGATSDWAPGAGSAAKPEKQKTEEEILLEFVGTRVRIGEDEAIVSRDDGRLGFLIRFPVSGDHKRFSREDTMQLIEQSKAEEERIKNEAAKRKADEKIAHETAACPVSTSSSKVSPSNEKAQQPTANADAEEADADKEDDETIEGLWEAVEGRKKQLEDEKERVNALPEGVEKEKQKQALLSLEQSIDEESMMVAAIEREEDMSASSSASSLPDENLLTNNKQLSEAAQDRRLKLAGYSKRQQDRRKKKELEEKKYWEDVEATRIATEEQRNMQRRGSLRSMDQQDVAMMAGTRRGSAEPGWGCLRQSLGNQPAVSKTKAVLKLAIAMGAGNSTGAEDVQ